MQDNKKNKIKRMIIGGIIGCLLGVAFCFPSYFLSSKAREERKIEVCMAMQYQVKLSVEFSLGSNDESIFYAPKEQFIVEAGCPSFEEKNTGSYLDGYGLNKNLDGIKYANLIKLKDVVLIAETDNEDRLISSAKDVALRHFQYKGLKKEYGAVVTYCDGRSEFVTEKDIKNLKFTVSQKR